MSPGRIAALGEPLIVLTAEREGLLRDADVFHRGLGGAELNVAMACAALGQAVSYLTRVGQDGFGEHVLATLTHAGIDTEAIEVDAERSTGLYIKERRDSGTDPMGHALGLTSVMHYYRTGSAASVLAPGYLQDPMAQRVLASADVIHTTGITAALSDDAYAMLQQLFARRTGSALLSFDVNWRPTLWRGRDDTGRSRIAAIAEQSDIVFMGTSEARFLFGTDDPNGLRQLLPRPRYLVIKNDAELATVFRGDSRTDLAPEPVTVVEAIGAGDAFAAGFLSALMDHASMSDCLRLAHQLAARALTSTSDLAVENNRFTTT